ncbi:MAG: hypothetical protein AB9915_01570 [Candidatus Dojkabacteria bacterium]
MELIKRSLLALILLLVVCLVWAGFSVYFNSTAVSVNSNASSYTKQLRDTFDTEELVKVTERTEESFPVQPDEFFSLIGQD